MKKVGIGEASFNTNLVFYRLRHLPLPPTFISLLINVFYFQIIKTKIFSCFNFLF